MASKVKNYAYYGGLGLSLCTEFAVAGYVGWWIGNWVDQKFHSAPWGGITGLILFFSAALYHLVRVLNKLQESLADTEKKP